MTKAKKRTEPIAHFTKNSAGFTLIELLVVIAIIALLASVILVSASAARARGRDGKRIADINQMSKALELYFNDNYGYPTATSGGSYQAAGVALSTLNVLVPKYLAQLPVVAEPADGNCSDATSGYPTANNTYWYESDNQSQFATKYTMTFCLGVGLGGALTPGAHYLGGGALH